MTAEPGCPVSELLLDWGNGDREALKEVFSLVYYELQRLARQQLGVNDRITRCRRPVWSTRPFSGLRNKILSHQRSRAFSRHRCAAHALDSGGLRAQSSRRQAGLALHGCLSIPASAKLVRKVTTLT